MSDKVNRCIKAFNFTIERIGKHLTDEFPNNLNLYSYDKIVSGIIEKNKSKPIDLFTEHILKNDKYHIAILTGDEEFFKSNRHENFTSADDEKIHAMFHFKDCWDKMTDDSKVYIKCSMKTLINISKKYVDLNCEMLSQLKK